MFVRAFRTPDLRKKLLFTGAMIVLFRFGSNLPAPGISERNVSYCSRMSSSSGVFAILNLLSGNSLLHLTVFAIGILPYILKRFFYAAAAVLVIIAVTTLIVFIEQAQRRIPVQYAKRITGRRVYGGAPTFIPVKVNQAGVVPVIFASSLLEMPQLAVSMFGNQHHPQGWVTWIGRNLDPALLVAPYVYFLAFFGLILGFAFFYVSITFNPDELSDNIRKYGGFVPGIRPGTPTSALLRYVLNRLTAPGSVYLALVAMLPLVALDKIGLGQDLQLSGVSLLIMVGVGLDTVKQIQSQLEQHSYEGFLR